MASYVEVGPNFFFVPKKNLAGTDVWTPYMKGDHVYGMQSSTVEVEEGHDLKGGHLCVKGVGVL